MAECENVSYIDASGFRSARVTALRRHGRRPPRGRMTRGIYFLISRKPVSHPLPTALFATGRRTCGFVSLSEATWYYWHLDRPRAGQNDQEGPRRPGEEDDACETGPLNEKDIGSYVGFGNLSQELRIFQKKDVGQNCVGRRGCRCCHDATDGTGGDG